MSDNKVFNDIGDDEDIRQLMADNPHRVLVVDDEPMHLGLLCALLQKSGYVCDTASNGEECLQKATMHMPDLVLLDVMMPVMDGFETCRLLKDNPLTCNIPVIMITSLNDRESKLRGLETGAADFLNKPIDAGEVRIKTKNLLQLKSYQKSLESSIAQLHSEARRRRQAEAGRLEARQTLEHTLKRLHIITSVLGEGVYVLDADGRLTFMNPEAERLLGWTERELLGKNAHETFHFQKADGTPLPFSECPVYKSIRSNACFRTPEDVFTHKDGTMIPISLVSTPITEDGKVTGSVAAFHDITDRKMAQEALKAANALLERQATTDMLTGVYNRLKFTDLLDAELQRSVRHGLPLSIMMFDIDHFKKINDTYGHHTGDIVLKEVTRIAKDTLRIYDSLARWGGEEFVILSPGNNMENTFHLAERLRENIAKNSYAHEGIVTASFGVTTFKEGDNADALLQRVDSALYKAKNSGRNRVESA